MSAAALPSTTVPLKRLITAMESGVSVNAVDSCAGESEFGVLKTSCVYTGRFDSSENKTVLPEEYSRVACPVKAGALVVSRMNTPDLVGATGYVSKDEPNLFLPDRLWQVFVDRTLADPKFVYWWTQSSLYRDQVRIACAGTSSSMQNLDQDSFRSFGIPRLPLGQQGRIANFLDEQTARIDALIAEKERLVTALSELHRAALWQLVTKGCTGNRTIDSGVEWIGEVPEHWTVRAIKWITPVLRGASPRPIDDPKYFDEDGQYGWVRIADVSASDGLLTSTEQRLSELGDSLSVKQEPGDLFLSIAGTVGKPCIAGIKCCIHDGFVWFPSIGHDALRDWLFAIFESGFAYAGLGKMGTQLNLNTDTVGSIRVPIPPVDEMRRILDRAREERAANLALQSHVEKHVSLLREYRSSLISAAVTGQLNVDAFEARQLEAV